MNFKTYFDQAWSDHTTQPEKVADEFSIGTELIENNEQIIQMIGLITHVMGEHLGRWTDGVLILKKLASDSNFIIESETEKAILRSIAVLESRILHGRVDT